MDTHITEIAQRLMALREIQDVTPEEMAEHLHMDTEKYLAFESAKEDFSVTFLQRCALKLGVDLVDLMTGENPRLSFYTVTRNGQGVGMKRRAGFSYQHMAHNLKGKLCEPFVVTAPYKEEEQNKEILLSTHDGQEFDFVLSGTLKVRMENHIITLNSGDAIQYDSAHGHGMIATGGADCVFLAVVLPR